MSDYRTTDGVPPPSTRQERRRRRLRAVLLALALLAALVAAAVLVPVPRIIHASGYVTHEEYAEVRAPLNGTIAVIVANSGADVARGDLLVKLVDSAERAILAEAADQLRKAEAELAYAEAEVADARLKRRQAVRTAQLKLKHAGARLKIMDELNEEGLASRRDYDDERLNEQLARIELDGLLARDGMLPEKRLAVLDAEVRARRNAVALARSRVEACEIRAPLSGRATRYEFVVGELVKPDRVLYEVFGGRKQILVLRIPARYATLVQAGQRGEVELESYRGMEHMEFKGRIEYLRDVVRTEADGNYRVAHADLDMAGRLVPSGTTAEAAIRIGTMPLWRFVTGLD